MRSAGAQTPHESGSPRMSSCAARRSGRVSRRQCTRSREWWICTPGYHSKVEVATKQSSPTRRMEGSGLKPRRNGFWTVGMVAPLSGSIDRGAPVLPRTMSCVGRTASGQGGSAPRSCAMRWRAAVAPSSRIGCCTTVIGGSSSDVQGGSSNTSTDRSRGIARPSRRAAPTTASPRMLLPASTAVGAAGHGRAGAARPRRRSCACRRFPRSARD